jgi:hypothetical protein
MSLVRCVPHGMADPPPVNAMRLAGRMKVTELGLAVGLLMTDFVIPQ